MRRLIPAEYGERTQYLARKACGNTIRFALFYPGVLREESMKQALAEMIRRIDILHSSFRAVVYRAVWQAHQDFDPMDAFSAVTVTGDLNEAVHTAMLKVVPFDGKLQLHCALISNGEQSAVVLNVGHMCADGSDSRYLLEKLMELYNCFCENGDPASVHLKNGTRNLEQACRHLTIRDRLKLYKRPASGAKTEYEHQIADFLKAIKGNRYEKMFLVALFTGIREGEVCGLQWECVDFSDGTILIDKQLQSLRSGVRGDQEKYALVPTKNGKERTITAAPYVMDLLWQVKKEQDLSRKNNSDLFQENGLVFADEFGTRITPQALYRAFKLVVAELNMKDIRFHDLRHSYAVVSLKSGDDVKTVQENLGHATAAFTLDVYGHVTEKMKKDSADRMQAFIKSVSR